VRFIKEVSGTLLSRAVSSLLGFGTSVIVARTLLPHGKGILATMTATAELAIALGTVGAGKSLTFLTAEARLPRRDVAGTASSMALLNGLLVGLLVVAAGPFLRRHVLADLPWMVVLAAAPLALMRVVALYGEGVTRGLREIFACNRAQVAQSAGNLAVVVALLALAALTPATALTALATGSLAATIIYMRAVRRAGLPIAPSLSRPVASSLIAYGVGYQAVGLLQMIHYRIDLFMVGHYGGPDQAGWYSTAANLAQVLWNVPTAVSFVVMPWVTSKDERQAGEGTAASARCTLWITIALSLALGLGAVALVRLLYGAAFLPSAAPLRLLLPGVVTNSLLLVLGGYLMGRGRTGLLTVIAGGSASLNIILNLLLLPRFGIRGAAVASSVTYTLAAFLVTWAVSRDSGTRFSHFLLVRRDDLVRLWHGLGGNR
jgi:O-antigen/teichoic acid export membrane protein